jgi:hypothetical protein
MKEYYLNLEIKKKLYKLISVVTELLDKNKIKYWTTGGTLLGQVRHRDLIPWDDDLDIDVPKTSRNIKKLEGLKKQLSKHNLEIIKSFFGYKIFYSDGDSIKRNLWSEHKAAFKRQNPSIKGRANISKYASKTYKRSKKPVYYDWKYPFLDIFLIASKGDKLYYPLENWQNCFYNKTDIEPLKKHKFGKLSLKRVKNPNTYLDSCYGKNWKTNGLISYDHKNEKFINPIKIKL